MDLSYPYPSIEINGRTILLSDIAEGRSMAKSAFEQDTFDFIRQWLTNIIYFEFQTSGSTGSSKKIIFTREQLRISAQSTITGLKLQTGTAVFLCLPTKYVAGRMMIVRAFENNMKIIAAEPKTIPDISSLRSHEVGLIALIPLQMESLLLASQTAEINNAKNILVGGAPILRHLTQLIKDQIKTAIWGTYGMTETLTHVALKDLRSNSDLYTTLPGIKISLDDRQCLVIETPVVSSPVITNDLGELIGSNSFKWLGRVDFMINSGGIKVVPELLETAIYGVLERLKINKRILIGGLPDEKLGEKVVLITEDFHPTPEIREEIKTAILNQFGKHYIPKAFLELKRFNMTKTGKISRFETLNSIRKVL